MGERSTAAYHAAALRDEPRLTETATAADLNRLRDRLLLRAGRMQRGEEAVAEQRARLQQQCESLRCWAIQPEEWRLALQGRRA